MMSVFNLTIFSKSEKYIFFKICFLYFLFYFFRVLSGNCLLADSYEYIEVSKLIHNGNYFFGNSNGEILTKRPFVYPFFLSFFVNLKPIIISLIQTIISVLGLFVFFKILKKIEVKITFLLVVALVFTPSVFIYTQLLMSEWIVLLLLNLLTLYLIEPFSKNNFFIIQIITLLLAFTKPVFYPFIYLNFIFFIGYFIKNRTFSIWLFLPILILQLYLENNKVNTGYKHFSSIENYNLINYNVYYFKSSQLGKQEAEKWHKSIYDNSSFKNKSFKEQNEYLKGIGVKEIKNNFLSYSIYHFKTAIRGILDPGRFDIMTFFKKEDGKQGFLEILNGNKSYKTLFKDKTALVLLLLIPILVFNFLKFFYFIKNIVLNNHSPLVYYLFGLVFYNILITGPVNSSRYMMPFQMVIIAFALKEFQKKSTSPS